MSSLMRTALVLLTLSMLLGAGQGCAQKAGDEPKDGSPKDVAPPKEGTPKDGEMASKKGPEPLPDDVVKAWQKAGSEAGWFSLVQGFGVEEDHRAAKGAVPTFRVKFGKQGALAKLPPPASPFGLDLSQTEVTDTDLKVLAAFKSLTYLNLPHVTDSALKALREIGLLHALDRALGEDVMRPTGPEAVRFLSLSPNLIMPGPKVTDAGLKELSVFKNLSILDLRYTEVTDAGLKEVAGFKSLSMLDLRGTEVTDTGLRELAGLKSLTVLDLRKTKVTDACLKELARIKSLSTFDLPITDSTLKALREMGLLHALIRANGKGMRPTGAETVYSLDLLESGVTDEGLKELAVLKNLSSLNLIGTRVTDTGLKELAGLKKLTRLDLYGTRVTDAGREELKKALPGCKIVR